MSTYQLSEDERRLTQRALTEYMRMQERKLAALRKSAGGRNWRSNEQSQLGRELELSGARSLRERLAAEYLESLR